MTALKNYVFSLKKKKFLTIYLFFQFQGHDIEVIAIDPDHEYTDDELQSDESSPEFEPLDHEMSILEFRAALQQSNHTRIYRKSMSLPHSPMHCSLDLTGFSLDDMQLLANPHSPPPSPDKSFDLAYYITADEIPAPKPRTCAISAKKMHYGEPETAPDVQFDEEEDEEIVEEKPDNPKSDPTWSPHQSVKAVKMTPKVKKTTAMKKVKTPKSEKKKSTVQIKKAAEVTQPKAVQLTKDKVHKIVSFSL